LWAGHMSGSYPWYELREIAFNVRLTRNDWRPRKELLLYLIREDYHSISFF